MTAHRFHDELTGDDDERAGSPSTSATDGRRAHLVESESMRVALASVPPRAMPIAAQAVRDLEFFISQFDPPAVTAQDARDCYEIAAELCHLDTLTRLHQTADVKDAASVAAACILHHFGWRLKEHAAPRAVELNAMAQQQLDEWAIA